MSAYQKLDIVCNDDRHRGRVVKIEVAHRVGAGGLWFARRAGRRPGRGGEPVALPAVQAHRHSTFTRSGSNTLPRLPVVAMVTVISKSMMAR